MNVHTKLEEVLELTCSFPRCQLAPLFLSSTPLLGKAAPRLFLPPSCDSPFSVSPGTCRDKQPLHEALTPPLSWLPELYALSTEATPFPHPEVTPVLSLAPQPWI